MYKRVVDLWSLTGWITGGFTALTLWLGLQVFPPLIAVIIACCARLLLTGALHEDGLADFIDGFGGGTSRERILEIMKDSRIGSYGVIGLVLYFLLLVCAVASFPLWLMPLIVLAADPWGKFCASSLINLLPYARKAEEAKNKLIYNRMSLPAFFISLAAGILPVLLLPLPFWAAIIAPLILTTLFISYLKYKLGGYTGDCCGALALLCELSFILCCLLICHYS